MNRTLSSDKIQENPIHNPSKTPVYQDNVIVSTFDYLSN